VSSQTEGRGDGAGPRSKGIEARPPGGGAKIGEMGDAAARGAPPRGRMLLKRGRVGPGARRI